ncbi:uncharacterized protein LOC116137982 isoform X2 [Pistacia vera]|uniref:uncharacterized protein LOC116137982 isoform X2 n=1 Tax=Pistacia vera TaxID=55513 RepID=UPI0012638671|nr:uncharacterized protein LOC116137982 isoform X2 [Pistacia vera]
MAATMALILFHFAGILVHAGVDHHLLWSDSSPGMIFTFSLGDNLVITNNTPDGFLLTRFIISEQADLCRDGLKWQVNVRDPM